MGSFADELETLAGVYEVISQADMSLGCKDYQVGRVGKTDVLLGLLKTRMKPLASHELQGDRRSGIQHIRIYQGVSAIKL